MSEAPLDPEPSGDPLLVQKEWLRLLSAPVCRAREMELPSSNTRRWSPAHGSVPHALKEGDEPYRCASIAGFGERRLTPRCWGTPHPPQASKIAFGEEHKAVNPGT
ncbi:uncharacterized protein LOC123429758 [Hordeum vulgare subsp. vulgare]|uniref:uncharacterized protein LOC123429758 n=1 Tax=Hordeum vulgare subsp. vulgare TaxID=112509 RepID=UPI001D1A4802|nr:uncharacterized protein LOC123429758 [Hordeum vulgare subsp. vulgare]